VPWNGSGQFSRVFSWVADKAAGLDILSSRMDTDSNDIATNGFGNCLTRDGQGQPSANLPMAGFRHTGVQNAINRTDYASLGQVQDDLTNWTIAGGTSDALTATYSPALTALSDGQICFVRATAANATTTPTFAPNALPARTITKLGGAALGIGDIAGSLAEIVLRYNAANTRWELLNPSNVSLNTGIATTGDVKLTIKSAADPGWLMFNDSTFGSAASGASSQSAANQALFNIMFAAPFTDATAPLFTSTGAATTRAAQGTAAAAWAANCQMSLPKVLGRALAVAGSGSGLTTRTLGQVLGEEAHALVVGEVPGHTHSGTTGNDAPDHSHSINGGASFFVGTSSLGVLSGGSGNAPSNATSISAVSGGASTRHAHNFTTDSGAGLGGGAHNNMQPTSFLNAMVKV
jgi:microcystin-dependent protein